MHSTFSVNNFVIDVIPLVRFWIPVGPINSRCSIALRSHTLILNRVSSHFRKWNSMIFPWIVHDSCCILHNLYEMKITNSVHSVRKKCSDIFKEGLRPDYHEFTALLLPLSKILHPGAGGLYDLFLCGKAHLVPIYWKKGHWTIWE